MFLMVDEKLYFEYKKKAEEYDKLIKKEHLKQKKLKLYREKNKEKFKKYYQEYHNNPAKQDIMNAINKRYYNKNRAMIQQKQKEYYIKNRTRILDKLKAKKSQNEI